MTYPLENNLISTGFNFALRLLRADSPETVKAINEELSEYKTKLDGVKETLNPASQDLSLFIFELTIFKFLNVLSARQARHFDLPYNREEMITNLKALSVIPKMGNASNALKLIRTVLALSAMIINFDETELSADLIEGLELTSALDIIRELYTLQTDHAAMKFEETAKTQPDYFCDVYKAFQSMLQGLVVNDRAPQTREEEFTHTISQIFLNKILKLRHVAEQRELTLMGNAKHENQLEKEVLHVLQLTRDQVSAIDAIIWRLNLHEQPTLRTILHRHIVSTHASMHQYLDKKMYADYRRKSVLSGFIDNTMSNGAPEDDVPKRVLSQFNQTVDILFAHVEMIETIVSSIQILIARNKLGEEDEFDYRKFQNIAHSHIKNLQFDVSILTAQAGVLRQEIPELSEVHQKLQFIAKVCDVYLYAITENTESKKKIKERSINVEVGLIDPDYLTNDKVTNAVSRLFQFKHHERVKHAQDTTQNRLDAIKVCAKDIELLNDKSKNNNQKTKNNQQFNTLIIDMYCHLLSLCQSTDEIDYLTQLDLNAKIKTLVKNDRNQIPYELLMDALPRLLKNNLDNGFVLGYFPKCELILERMEKNEYSLGGWIHGKILDCITEISQYLEHHGMVRDGNHGKLESKKGQLLAGKIKLHHFDVSTQLTHSFTQVSPEYLQYRSAILSVDINEQLACPYPDANSMLTQFFELNVRIIKANNQNDIDELHQLISAATIRTQASKIELEDAYGVDAPIKSNNQVDLHDAETNCLSFLSVMLSMKKQELKLDVSEEDKTHNASELEMLSQKPQGPKVHSSTTAALMNFYIHTVASILKFMETPFSLDNEEHRHNLVEKAQVIFGSFAGIQFATKTDFLYQYNQYIPVHFFNEMIRGLEVVFAPDRAPQGEAQEFIYHYMALFINQLINLRKQIESLEEKSTSLGQSQKVEYAQQVVQIGMRQQMAKMDALIGRCNLVGSQDVRKRYVSHLRVYGVREEFCDEKLWSSSQVLNPVSALVDIRLGAHKANIQQIKLAIKILLKNIYECSYALTALAIVTNNEYNNYEDFQLVLKQQLLCSSFDAIQLLNSGLGSLLESSSAAGKLRRVYIAYLMARDCLTLFPKPVFLDGDYLKVGHGIEIYDISLMDVVDQYSHEAFARVIQTRFDNQLAESKTPEERLTTFSRAIAAHKDMISRYEMTSSDDNIAYLNRIQLISDFYLYAYSSCETVEESTLFNDPDIKDKVFSLKLASYNGHARNAIYAMLTESITLKNNEKSEGDSCVSQFNVEVIESCLKSFSLSLKEKDSNKKLYNKSDKEQTRSLSFVYMNSQVYLYYINMLTDMIQHVTARVPALAKCASELKNAGLLKEKEHFYKYLQNKSEALHPLKFSFRPPRLREVSLVGSSFLSNTPTSSKPSQTTNKSSRDKSKSTKGNATAQKGAKPHREGPGTASKEVRVYFKNNPDSIKEYYLGILNDQSYRVRNNIPLRVNVMLGFAESLPLFSNETTREYILNTLALHLRALLECCRPSFPEDIFDGRYSYYQSLLAPYQKANEVIVVEQPTLIRKSFKIGSNIPKVNYLVETKLRAQTPAVSTANRGSTQRVLADNTKLKTLDPFFDFRKNIPLERIKLSHDELKVMQCLHDLQLFPLLKGSVVVNSIRRIPYGEIACLCFAEAAELETILKDNQKFLNISELSLIDNQYFRVVFHSPNDKQRNYLDITFVPAKGANMAPALHQRTLDVGIGIAIYYCIFTKSLVDPCRIYTRTKNGVLDVMRNLDPKFNIDQFFQEHPDRMLTVLFEDALCRKYEVFLEASFIKQVILRNRYHLIGDSFKNKLSQDIFDNLFINGFAHFTILHDEYDMMHILFPMFQRNRHDYKIIRFACEQIIERYQECEKKFQFDRTTRILKLPESTKHNLRLEFINALLKQKFMETHYLGRYATSDEYFEHQSLGDDIVAYLGRSSFDFDRQTVIDLELEWSNEINALKCSDRARIHLSGLL